MSYPATFFIPKKHVTKEIREILTSSIDPRFSTGVLEETEKLGIVSFFHGEIFASDVEDYLVSKRIPFDCTSDPKCYGEYETRYFRPSDDPAMEIDVIVREFNEFNDIRYVPTYELSSLASLILLNPEEAHLQLKRLLNKYDPQVDSIENYA